MTPRITLLVITDGRWDYLEQTLISAAANLRWDFERVVLVNDSGDFLPADVIPFLQKVSPASQLVIVGGERRGLAGAIQAGWDVVGDCDYIFHLEDDFTFPAPVDIAGMVAVLQHDHRLAQVALLRQPWSPEEQRAGSIYATYPGRFSQEAGYVVQKALFTFNPCLYPRWVADEPAGLEQQVTDGLAGCRFAYLGKLDDPPRCIHIGHRRSRGYRW